MPSAAGTWPRRFVVWGMFVRLVFVLHSTWFVNSASHMWGYRNYETTDDSRNNWWVGLITYGEGWHNNHHAYPRMAPHGHKWWEFDVTYPDDPPDAALRPGLGRRRLQEPGGKNSIIAKSKSRLFSAHDSIRQVMAQPEQVCSRLMADLRHAPIDELHLDVLPAAEVVDDGLVGDVERARGGGELFGPFAAAEADAANAAFAAARA